MEHVKVDSPKATNVNDFIEEAGLSARHYVHLVIATLFASLWALSPWLYGEDMPFLVAIVCFGGVCSWLVPMAYRWLRLARQPRFRTLGLVLYKAIWRSYVPDLNTRRAYPWLLTLLLGVFTLFCISVVLGAMELIDLVLRK